MRMILIALAITTLGVSCAEPTAVYYKGLDTPRFTRVNLRSDGQNLRHSSILALPNDLRAGSPATVTMFSNLEVRMTIHGAAYVMRPVATGEFSTDDVSIAAFLEKFFVASADELNLAAMGPAELEQNVIEGKRVIGMTKEQVLTALGPPMYIDANIPADNLPRAKILASDRWKYMQNLILLVGVYVELIFGDGKLIAVIQ